MAVKRIPKKTARKQAARKAPKTPVAPKLPSKEVGIFNNNSAELITVKDNEIIRIPLSQQEEGAVLTTLMQSRDLISRPEKPRSPMLDEPALKVANLKSANSCLAKDEAATTLDRTILVHGQNNEDLQRLLERLSIVLNRSTGTDKKVDVAPPSNMPNDKLGTLQDLNTWQGNLLDYFRSLVEIAEESL